MVAVSRSLIDVFCTLYGEDGGTERGTGALGRERRPMTFWIWI